MKAQVTIDRVSNVTGKRSSKIEFFFHGNGLVIHRHGFVEDNEKHRSLFPVYRKFGDKLYVTQEIVFLPDELNQALLLFTRKNAAHLMGKFFRHNWFTRILWKFTLKVTLI